MTHRWRLWAASLCLGGIMATPAHAGWTYSAKRDAMTDERIATAAAYSTDGKALLGVRCIGGQFDAALFGANYLGEDDATVAWRFDRSEPDEDSWATTAKGTGVYAPGAGYFARRIIGGSSLVVDTYDYRGVRYRYTFSLAGSGSAVSRILTDCGLPVVDPRTTDQTIWRRVIDDIDTLDAESIAGFQTLLVKLGVEGVEVNGKHDLATYRAASKLWVSFWEECRLNRDLGGSCHIWNPEDASRYPVEVVDLVLELNRDAILIKRNREAYAKSLEFKPVRRPAPNSLAWTFEPTPEDLSYIAPKGSTVVGRAVVNCDVNQWGGLRDCNIVEESPAGMGFGKAAVDEAVQLYESRTLSGGRLTLEINFPPAAVPVKIGG